MKSDSDVATARKYLTKGELAASSPYSASAIQRLKDQGRIPFFQPAGKGGKLLFPPNALEAISESTAFEAGAESKLPGPKPYWMKT